jgi:uncharacterized protein YbaR (Trm112 family)
MDLAWLEQFLPLLRCPASKQPLRWATPEERKAAPAALASEDGRHVYSISDGIPILLPPNSVTNEGK